MSTHLTRMAMNAQKLSPACKAVLTSIAWASFDESERARISRHTICDRTGLSESTVKRAIKKLTGERLISILRAGDGLEKAEYRIDQTRLLEFVGPEQESFRLTNLREFKAQPVRSHLGSDVAELPMPREATTGGVIMNPPPAERGVTVNPQGGHDEPGGGSARTPRGVTVTPPCIQPASGILQPASAASLLPKSGHSLAVRKQYARENRQRLRLWGPDGFALTTMADGSKDADVDEWLAEKAARRRQASAQADAARSEHEARRAEAIALQYKPGTLTDYEAELLQFFNLEHKRKEQPDDRQQATA